MENDILLLIGTVDTLIYLIETDKRGRKSKGATGSLKRLGRMRRELLVEGVRHSKIMRAARNGVSEVSTKLRSVLSRPLPRLGSVAARDVEPPPLPSSSSSGPKALLNPAMLHQVGKTLMDMASAGSAATARSTGIRRLIKADAKAKARRRRAVRR